MPGVSRVSVIVPTYNSGASLPECLRSIFSQEAEADVEVVVVDDGSTDATSGVVTEQFPSAVLVRTEGLGCDAARQAGMDAATGDVLANTDADCIVSGGWLQGIIQAIGDGATAVTGPVIHKPNALASIVAVTDFPDFQDLKPRRILNFPGCNFALRTETIEQYGYHLRKDHSCGADRLLAWRIAREGGHIAYSPEVAVYHYPPTDPRSLIRRRRRYAMVAADIRRSDNSLPGGRFARLGRFAAPIYCGARLSRDMRLLAQLASSHRIPRGSAPAIAIGAITLRACDLAFMLTARPGEASRLDR